MKFRLLIQISKTVVLIDLIVPSGSAKSKLSALGISFTRHPSICLISEATTLAIIKVHLTSLWAEFLHLAYDFFRIPRLPLWALDIPATTTIGGSGGYKTYGDYSNDLKSARLILAPDRDSSGLKYVANFQRDFAGQIEGYCLAGEIEG